MKALSTLVKGLGKVTEPTTAYMWLKAIIESAEAELEELRVFSCLAITATVLLMIACV